MYQIVTAQWKLVHDNYTLTEMLINLAITIANGICIQAVSLLKKRYLNLILSFDIVLI